MKMRILYKHRTRGVDVEAVHILGIASGLKEFGHEVDFVSPPGIQIKSSNSCMFDKITDFFSFNLPTVFYEVIMLLYNISSYLRGLKKLRVAKYDIIYERYAFFEFSSVLLSKKYKIPVILEVNGSINRKDPTHARKVVLKSICSITENKLFHHTYLITVVSENLKESLIENGVDPRKIIKVPNAVNDNFINYRKENQITTKYRLENKIVIGFVGSFTFWHGLDFLISCLPHIIKVDNDVHLLLVGDGPERLAIEKLVDKCQISDYVTFSGSIPHKDIPKYISAMDITTMPDSNEFGSPMKIFEYMALRKPVIAAEYGPIKEIIQDGKTGLLFRPHNKKQFIEKLCLLIANHSLREKIGEKGYQKVLKEHTWQKNVEIILDAYDRIKK